MSFIGIKPEKSVWEEICKEFALMRPPFHHLEDDTESVATDVVDYDPTSHSPVMFGHMVKKVTIDGDAFEEFDPSKSHPVCVGFTMLKKPARTPTPPPPPAPPKDTCTPKEYLEHYIFPVLLPALLAMLKVAKKERCYERKRFRFNGCDFLTEYLWRHNSHYPERTNDNLENIPFVKKLLAENPRPPLPLSLVWTEEEAAVIIQSFWKGYKVRRMDEIQELRQWQREWREDNADIKRKVEDFWKEHEPGPEQDNLRKSAKLKRSSGYPACHRLRTWTPEPDG